MSSLDEYQDGVVAALERLTARDESLLDVFQGSSAPSGWWGLLGPFGKLYVALKTKSFLVALTDQRVLVVQHGRFNAKKFLGRTSVGLEDLRGVRLEKGVLSSVARVDTRRGSWVLEVFEARHVETFQRNLGRVRHSG